MFGHLVFSKGVFSERVFLSFGFISLQHKFLQCNAMGWPSGIWISNQISHFLSQDVSQAQYTAEQRWINKNANFSFFIAVVCSGLVHEPLVCYPSRWSLLFIFGFLWWSLMRPPGRCRRTPFSFQLQIIFFPSPESSVWYSRSPRFGLIWSVIKYKCLFLPSEQADRIRWIWTLIRNNLTFVSNIYLIWSTIRHIINQVLSPSPWIGKHFNFNLIWSTSINSSFPIYCISDR